MRRTYTENEKGKKEHYDKVSASVKAHFVLFPREKQSQEMKQRKSKKCKETWSDPIKREQQRVRSFKLWQDPEWARKMIESQGRKPTLPELELQDLIQELNLPYTYCGDGSLIIKGFNPDFVNVNGQKKLVELYGEHWHNLEDSKERDCRRLQAYESLGYTTLIIWGQELKEPEKVKEKLLSFDRGVW